MWLSSQKIFDNRVIRLIDEVVSNGRIYFHVSRQIGASPSPERLAPANRAIGLTDPRMSTIIILLLLIIITRLRMAKKTMSEMCATRELIFIVEGSLKDLLVEAGVKRTVILTHLHIKE